MMRTIANVSKRLIGTPSMPFTPQGIADKPLESSAAINSKLMPSSKGQETNDDAFDEEGWLHEGAPQHLLCPIGHCLMRDPVTAPDGQTYSRAALQETIDYARKRESVACIFDYSDTWARSKPA